MINKLIIYTAIIALTFSLTFIIKHLITKQLNKNTTISYKKAKTIKLSTTILTFLISLPIVTILIITLSIKTWMAPRITGEGGIIVQIVNSDEIQGEQNKLYEVQNDSLNISKFNWVYLQHNYLNKDTKHSSKKYAIVLNPDETYVKLELTNEQLQAFNVDDTINYDKAIYTINPSYAPLDTLYYSSAKTPRDQSDPSCLK